MDISLIIAVYNQARNLELILNSIKTQSCQDFEVVIADDGSSDGTEEVIGRFRQQCPNIPISFVTQEDKGFRKTMILNKAINRSRGDYLIFIDGDMLLERRFIELHMKYRKTQQVLCGYRGVKLTESYTDKIINGEALFSTHPVSLFLQKLKGNITNPMRGLILKNPLLRAIAVSQRDSLSGCNFSLYREALIRVNGFNEEVLVHGYNDYELGHRLKWAEYQLMNVSKLCNTYHLYHPTRKKCREETNKKIAQIDASTDYRCAKGMQQ